MPNFDYDLFVIGAGSGGVRGARMAAAAGAKVGICEEYRVGGTCVLRGCIPKKLMVYASHFHHDIEDARRYGWSVEGTQFDWHTLIANKDKEIDRLNGVYLRLLDQSGVTLYPERGVLEDPHTIRLGDDKVTAKHILIATGGWPTVLDIPGAKHGITSNEVFHLERQPKRVVIVGGGYIAVEFAGIFNGLGSEVVQLYRSTQILRGFDEDVRDHLAEEIRNSGIDLRVNTNVTKLKKRDGGLDLELTSDEHITADCVLFATGREPATNDLGMDNAGVGMADDGSIMVDEYSRTSVEHIFAVGDVTNRIQLTPVALMESMAVVQTLFRNNPTPSDHCNIPSAVFSQPEVATVGLTEFEAKDRHGDIDIYRSSFRPLKHTVSGRDTRAMMKIIVEKAGGRVVGCHMVGEYAAEIMQGVAVAIKAGATKDQFDATVGIHPSAAEEFVTMREPVQ